MQISIQNEKLVLVINLLFQLPLKGKQSRQRSKLIKLLDERLEEVAEQEKELLKEHCHLDENGEPKKKNDDKEWDVINLEAYRKDRKELYEEELVIEGNNNTGMLSAVKKVLDECEMELSGADAAAYDYLCDQFGADE